MTSDRDLIFDALIEIVGEDYVTKNSETTANYARDLSFIQGKKPDYVVFPKRTSDIQAIVKMANAESVPIVPRSSPVSFHGAGIPTEGGIIIDLRGMDRIHEINDRNRYAIIEPGVTFLQLQQELKKHGFRLAKPFLDSPSSSVVSSYMERNPVATAADFTYGTEHIISYKLVSPLGEVFTVGHPPLDNTPASAPDGPGLNFYRIFQGAQGTLGIVTWMVIRVLPVPKRQKIFFFSSTSLARTVEIIRHLQKYELGLECFAMNQFNLSILASSVSDDVAKTLEEGSYVGPRGAIAWDDAQLQQFNDMRIKLPPWTGMICLSAVGPIPEEKIAYQTEDLTEIAAIIGAELKSTVDGANFLEGLILEELLFSRRMQLRFGYKGASCQIMFYSEPDRLDAVNEVVLKFCNKFQYPVGDLGFFILPIERARAFYCCLDLHFRPNDPDESSRVLGLFDGLSRKLAEKGAFFDRPYGKWATFVYEHSGTYAHYLKEIKRAIDPNNIMNPGKLCFHENGNKEKPHEAA